MGPPLGKDMPENQEAPEWTLPPTARGWRENWNL